MNTQPQSERECGPRMLMYMVKIGKFMKQLGNRYTFDKLLPNLDHFLAHERRIEAFSKHSLAHTTRKATHEAVQNKQIELNSI